MDVYKATQLSRETGPLPFHAKTLLAFPWNRVQFDQYCIELVGSVAGSLTLAAHSSGEES